MCEITKIVLTGGPCAGKTTALQTIEKEFTEKGYKVFIISESATELINSGAKPFGALSIPIYSFQKELLKYQLYKETMYENMALALPENTKCLIVCDRGILDNKAYLSSEEFSKLLEELSLKEIDLLTRYQAILHLVTAADGAEEFYTLENNNARTETIEEARKLDAKTLHCWIGHPNLHIISNNQSFKNKMKIVTNIVHKKLRIPVPIQIEQKFLIAPNNIENVLSRLNGVKKMKIEQIYLSSLEECCLRKMSDENATMYYEICKKDIIGEKGRIKTMNRISEKEYLKRTSTINDEPIRKSRYSFVYNGQYFRLDIFHNIDLCLLEVEATEQSLSLSFPEGIQVLADVTDNPEYRNFFLFQKLNVKTKKYIYRKI